MDIIMPKQLCKTALELLDYNLTLVEKVEGNSTILQDLDKRKHWGKKNNFLNFNKDKCQILPRGKKNPCNNNMWGQRSQGAAWQGRLWSADLHMSLWEAQNQRQPTAASVTLWKGEDLQSEYMGVFFYDPVIK